MHEIGVVRQIIKTVEDFAKQNNVTEVSEIVLDVGELSLVIPKYVEDIYPVVTPGPIMEKAKMVLNVVPGIAECDECDELFNVIEHEGYFPNFGSFDKTVLSGETCTVKEIHIPEG